MKAKCFAIGLVLVFISLKTIAQVQPDFSQLQKPPQQDLKKLSKYNKAIRLKHVGMGLTAAGAVLAVVGVSLISSANPSTTYSSSGSTSTQYNNDSNAVTGVLCLIGGVYSIGAGIPLWIVGAHKQRKYAPKELKVSLEVAPQRVGLNLRF